MSLMTCRTKTLTVAFLVAIGVCVLRWPSLTVADAPTPQSRSPELVKNQQEQVNALREAADLASKQFARGTGSVEEVDRLNRKLMKTRLRMATSAEDRLGVLRDALVVAKEAEAFTTRRFKAGLVSDVALLEAKAYRLSIEEKLLEAGVK